MYHVSLFLKKIFLCQYWIKITQSRVQKKKLKTILYKSVGTPHLLQCCLETAGNVEDSSEWILFFKDWVNYGGIHLILLFKRPKISTKWHVIDYCNIDIKIIISIWTFDRKGSWYLRVTESFKKCWNILLSLMVSIWFLESPLIKSWVVLFIIHGLQEIYRIHNTLDVKLTKFNIGSFQSRTVVFHHQVKLDDF